MSRIRETGAELWTIANDDPARLVSLRESEGLEFDILLDPGAETIRAWGLLNADDGRGVPHPTVAIIDRDGTVRYVLTETDYRLRPPSADLVELLRALDDGE